MVHAVTTSMSNTGNTNGLSLECNHGDATMENKTWCSNVENKTWCSNVEITCIHILSKFPMLKLNNSGNWELVTLRGQ